MAWGLRWPLPLRGRHEDEDQADAEAKASAGGHLAAAAVRVATLGESGGDGEEEGNAHGAPLGDKEVDRRRPQCGAR